MARGLASCRAERDAAPTPIVGNGAEVRVQRRGWLNLAFDAVALGSRASSTAYRAWRFIHAQAGLGLTGRATLDDTLQADVSADLDAEVAASQMQQEPRHADVSIAEGVGAEEVETEGGRDVVPGCFCAIPAGSLQRERRTRVYYYDGYERLIAAYCKLIAFLIGSESHRGQCPLDTTAVKG